MTRRQEQINDQLQVELADLLRREVKHPALQDIMLSITHVEVSPDFGNARVYISLLGGAAPDSEDDRSEADVLEALERSAPFLHRQLVKRLHLRRVPYLHFFSDPSIAEGARMTSLMRDVARSEGREL